MSKTSTKEWAPHSANICSGCSNDCAYCYAKAMSIRFARDSCDSWHVERVSYEKARAPWPMLDDTAPDVVAMCAPYVTDSIWLGKANRLRANGADEAHLEAGRALVAAQNDDVIRALYQRLKGHPLVRWKDSIRTVVGLAEEKRDAAGQACTPEQQAGDAATECPEAQQHAEAIGLDVCRIVHLVEAADRDAALVELSDLKALHTAVLEHATDLLRERDAALARVAELHAKKGKL